MFAKHEGVKVGKDNKGIYFEIQFTKDLKDKVYLDEFFEDVAEKNATIDINIAPHNKPRARPEAFFEKCDPKERERIKKELDLRELYQPVRKDLNVYNYLVNYHIHNPPSMQFDPQKFSTPEKHKIWATKVLNKVKELVNYNLGEVPLEIEEGPQTEFKNIILKKYYFQTAPYLKIPAILLYPKEIKGKLPGIIAVHGHNKGKINTVGMAESSSNSYYGMDLALTGKFAVLALDQWGWGERRGHKNKIEERAEETFSLSALLLGLTAIGIRTWEVSRSIDFLKTFDFVDDKFGIIGQSGGGTTAAFGSALDNRIDAAVVSGYFCSWLWSIFSMRHCACNFVPHILRYIDIHDLMAIRAPKPTFIVAGSRDPIFPIEGVEYSYRKLMNIYKLYGKEENLQIDVIKGAGHIFRGDKAYPWLEKILLSQ
ncbi:MAG: alpha/beta hydrolase family protein [Promethearchaeota archaeon]